MIREQIMFTKGDSKGTIDDLIKFLQDCKDKGATDYEMEWSHDPTWSYKWLTTYRYKSDEEVKSEKIKELEEEIKKIKQS